MNCGLGNLTTLKGAILPSAVRARTDWDDVLQRLGKGVAAAFESFCNRKFARLVDATFTVSGPAIAIALDRFPVEEVSAVDTQGPGDADWTDALADGPLTHLASGVVHFPGLVGSFGGLIRVTFTGGFWFDETEDASGEQPDGAALIPDDLQLAWTTQVHALAEKLGVLKHGAMRTPEAAEAQAALVQSGILAEVKPLLTPYRRYC